jgi:hypothetical protein
MRLPTVLMAWLLTGATVAASARAATPPASEAPEAFKGCQGEGCDCLAEYAGKTHGARSGDTSIPTVRPIELRARPDKAAPVLARFPPGTRWHAASTTGWSSSSAVPTSSQPIRARSRDCAWAIAWTRCSTKARAWSACTSEASPSRSATTTCGSGRSASPWCRTGPRSWWVHSVASRLACRFRVAWSSRRRDPWSEPAGGACVRVRRSATGPALRAYLRMGSCRNLRMSPRLGHRHRGLVALRVGQGAAQALIGSARQSRPLFGATLAA